MKAIVNKVLYISSISIIGAILVLVVLLTLLHFSGPYLETRHNDIEKFVSDLVGQPVSFGKIAASNNGLEPVLKLYDVAVFNEAKTKILLRVKELQVGVDLVSSLLKWSIKPGLLIVRGAGFFIDQDKDGGLHVFGVSNTNSTTPAFSEILKWLFEQSSIDLSDIAITLGLADGELLKFYDLNLKLYNGVLQHELKISAKLMQNNLPARFEADLKLRGDISKQAVSSLTGDVIIEDCLFKVPDKFSDNNFFIIPPVGNINLLSKHQKIASSFLREPLSISSLEGRIIWQKYKNDFNVHIDKFKYRDNYLSMIGDLKFLFSAEALAPIVDMKLEFSFANLAKAKLYYPTIAMPPDAVTWLDKAFVSSKPMTGNIILQGPIDKFPFDNNEGRFLVNADIHDVHLNYNDAWPSLEHINGKLIFANRSMVILSNDAKIMQAPVQSIKAIIPDLNMPILSIDSIISTDSSIGLKFVNSTPLKATIASKMQSVSLAGPMQLDLKMSIPLTLLVLQKDTKVDGRIVLHDNYLRPYDLSFGLNNINGELRFTENNLVSEDRLSGELFGRPVYLTVDTLKAKANDTITQIIMTGDASVASIEKSFATKLYPYVSGNFNYQAVLDLHSLTRDNVFELNSNLQGVAIGLPKPFSKPIDRKSKFNLAYYFGGNKISRIIINYNNQINAALTKKGGEIKFGSAPATIGDAPGIIISGCIKELDWSLWHSYLSKIGNNFSKNSIAIRRVSLDIDKLCAFGQVLNKAILQAKPKNNGWEIMLSMPTIQGKIFFLGGTNAQVQGNFQKLYLDSSSGDQKSRATLKPKELPPLNFIIDDFRYGNKRFNRIEFITNKKSSGVEINKITINGPKFNLTASGDWVMIGNKQKTNLRGKISSNDIGGLLKQLELTNDLVGGIGEADFSLRWPNAIYKPALREIDGTFVIRARKGYIVNFSGTTELKLGFSKALNIFSLRRLSLDLGGLNKKGFGFDTLEGSFDITKGNAVTNNFMLDGPIAQVRARGRIGLASQDYNLRMSVAPHITSSVPVTATFVGGPIVGVISWVVAEAIIAPVLKKTTTYLYYITGGWDNPTIKNI